MSSTAGVVGVLVGGLSLLLLMRPRTSRWPAWRATATPLASIIGSGFLVSAPVLRDLVGYWAPVAVTGLLLVAYLVGAAVRENIAHVEPLLEDAEADGHRLVRRLEGLSAPALAAAYFVSVAYYLVLFASFVLKGLDIDSPSAVKVLVTVVLVAIGAVGVWRGFAAVERVEIHAVSLKLAVITAILAALVVHDAVFVVDGSGLGGVQAGPGPEDVTPLLGLLIIVQGFETSRYLGDTYPAELRIRTMRAAQLVAAGIYLAFFALLLPLYSAWTGEGEGVAAIVDVLAPVAPVLPAVVLVGALASQSSAAIADANGATGLLHEVTGQRLSVPAAYPVVAAVAVAVTWLTDVYSLIALASRAFALYYALQCTIAALSARGRGRADRAVGFAALALLCVVIVLVGAPAAEG